MLHGDWAELSPVWNWQYTWASHALRGDGGRARRALHRRRRSPGPMPAASCRCGSAAPTGPSSPRISPSAADRRRTGIAPHGEPALPARRCSAGTCSRSARFCDYLDRFDERPDGDRWRGWSDGGGAGLAADALGAAARPARPLAARRRDRGHRPRPRLRRALERPDAGRASLFGGRAFAAGRGALRPARAAGASRAGGWRRCCTTRRST